MGTPRYREGDEESAAWLNETRAKAEAAKIVAVPPLYVTHSPTCQTLTFHGPDVGVFKITSGGPSGKYGGVEQKPGAAGTWSDMTGGRAPTTTVDPIYERNLNATVPVDGTVVVRAERNATGVWIFQRGTCS